MKQRIAPLVLVAACGGSVPSNPTYFSDVQAILRANCDRCHGADPSDPKARYLDQCVPVLPDTVPSACEKPAWLTANSTRVCTGSSV